MHLHTGEHLARRVLSIQKAIKKNPRQPDFSSAGPYTRHMQDTTGNAYTPSFDKFVAEEQKTEALTLKQDRLAREEAEQEESRKKKPKDKKKKGNKKDDDDDGE